MDLAVVRVQPNQLSVNPASHPQQTDRKLFVQNNVSEFNAISSKIKIQKKVKYQMETSRPLQTQHLKLSMQK